MSYQTRACLPVIPVPEPEMHSKIFKGGVETIVEIVSSAISFRTYVPILNVCTTMGDPTPFCETIIESCCGDCRSVLLSHLPDLFYLGYNKTPYFFYLLPEMHVFLWRLGRTVYDPEIKRFKLYLLPFLIGMEIINKKHISVRSLPADLALFGMPDRVNERDILLFLCKARLPEKCCQLPEYLHRFVDTEHSIDSPLRIKRYDEGGLNAKKRVKP